jgi:N6-adenosine-specific RNA methylase IME4/ParB-like chromosome segregation protein Spo0J
MTTTTSLSEVGGQGDKPAAKAIAPHPHTPPADQYQLLPPLIPDEYAALKADIRARGIMVPVEKDELGNILDGYHRSRIVAELRAEGHLVELPVNIRTGLSHEEKVEHALSLNLIRRHLTREQRQEIVLRLRIEGWSTRRIAGQLNMSDATVRRDIDSIASNVAMPDRIITIDGRTYPAQRAGLGLGLGSAEEQAIKRAVNRANRIEAIALESMGAGKYAVIYADPPYRYDFAETDSRAIENQYPTMALEDICALPVGQISNERAVLFLWAPAPKFLEAGAVVKAWGFEYLTHYVWDKVRMGMGYWGRGRHEDLLIARRGDMPPPEPGARPETIIPIMRSHIHSHKPTEFYEIIERMFPSVPKIELFSRTPHPSWDSWGLEASREQSEEGA